MALITVGSIDDFSVVATGAARARNPSLAEVDTFGVLAKKAPKVPPDAFDFAVSPERRGLALRSIELRRGFAKHLPLVFRPTNNVYYVAWVWDMRGLSYYPGEHADPASCLIPLKSGQIRQLMADGALLFAPRTITGGLGVRMQIWESKQGTRNFGEIMTTIAGAIKGSKLNTVLMAIAGGAGLATGGASAAITLADAAALELAQLVGEILRTRADKQLDYFDGHFAVAERWDAGPYTETHPGTAVTFNRLT